MIRLPQRSVTRFFIPLIDVLILLFCIYLVMPLGTSVESEAQQRARLRTQERLRELERELQEKERSGDELSAEKRRELQRLRTEELQRRLVVRVLEIDPKDGRLFYRARRLRGGVEQFQRVEVRNQADARTLIEQDRRNLGAGQRELYYLILYPRDPTSGYPTRKQRLQCDRWFEGVALGYDIPGSAPGGGQP
jgi:hypothetical protein